MGTARTYSPTDALLLLQEQHDLVDELMSELDSDALSVERRLAVLHELSNQLTAHTTMEELLFYPAVRAKQTEEFLLDPVEEHLAVRRALAALHHTPVGSTRFDARLAVLREEFDHHAREEEEQVLFPKLRRLMSEQELVALGNEMRVLFDHLVSRAHRREVVSAAASPAMR